MPKQSSFVFTGFHGMDSSSGIESLGPVMGKPGRYNLSVAENARFTQDGGVYVRNGIDPVIDTTSSSKIDSILGIEKDAFSVMFFKNGTSIYQTTDPDSGVYYDIGVTRDADQIDFLYSKRKNLFAINQVDKYLIVDISTVVGIDTGAGTVTLRSGDIDEFDATGTIYIRGISVTYSGKSSNDLTGCTGLTGAMAIGDIVTQTTEDNALPKGTTMAELESSSLLGGVAADASSLYYSEPSTNAEPELFYSYPTTYIDSLPSDITAIVSGNRATLVGMTKGIKFTSGFTPDGYPLFQTLSTVHSIPNAFCITQTDEEFGILTGEGRILYAGQTDAGFNIITNPLNVKNDMDYRIQTYIQRNMDKQNTSTNFIHFASGCRELTSSIRMNTGINQEIVYQKDIRQWSVDTSKNIACKTVFKGSVYAGSDSEGIIYKDGSGRTDDQIPINFRATTGKMTIDEKRINFDVLNITVNGLLSALGQFYVRLIADGVPYTFETSAEELIDNGNMDLSTGISIGQGAIGGEEIGGGGDAVEGFEFEFSIEHSLECKTLQVEIESIDEGTAIELRGLRVDIETEAEQLIPTF